MVTKDQIKELKRIESEARAALQQASNKLLYAENLMAQQVCPHKVGDIIDCGGYSHKGKKMIVDKITAHRWSENGWRVCGRVLKKDGSIGNVFYDFMGVNNEKDE